MEETREDGGNIDREVVILSYVVTSKRNDNALPAARPEIPAPIITMCFFTFVIASEKGRVLVGLSGWLLGWVGWSWAWLEGCVTGSFGGEARRKSGSIVCNKQKGKTDGRMQAMT